MKSDQITQVLVFLFKSKMLREGWGEALNLEELTARVMPGLADAGFDMERVEDAFAWLESLVLYQQAMPAGPRKHAMRILSAEEARYLDTTCQCLIQQLYFDGLLDEVSRELVIHQLLAFKNEHIDLSLVKLVTLLVLATRDPQALVAASARFMEMGGHAVQGRLQ
ncbi:MAG: hypothetical protein A3J38_04400 [Gammaproteobacteria bacterium RIFCSPHIGHO2_12_FULL_45_9]|nr:MAG: hypothetical protein A3J38_04400 [Gammaproteobacteria bacterium RIFCSPHIGHO2_12_FULL_45_9]